MEMPKYIVIRVDVMRKGTNVELTDITDEVEDVILKADRKTEDVVDKKVDAVGYCESCDWCEYEFVKSDGSEDKRYRNHKWCGLHERSTKKDGFCHWFLERLGEDDKN